MPLKLYVMNNFHHYFTLVPLATQALRKNRMRSLLSVLGIVIGITALTFVLHLSAGAKSIIAGQLATFGADTIFVQVHVPHGKDNTASSVAFVSGVQIKTLKLADSDGVRKLSNVKETYGAVVGQEKVVFAGKNKKSFLLGTTAGYALIDNGKVAEGRFFTDADSDNLARVLVLGANIKKELFGEQNPIGKFVSVKGFHFKVIGVMEKRGAAFIQNYDDYVYLPIKTMQKLILGYDYLLYFVAQVEDSQKIELIAEDIRRFLRRQHHISSLEKEKADFTVETSKQAMEQIDSVFSAVAWLFGALASISLIVGGVGVMNMMYVNVTERIAEIGLRKALGAHYRDILFQFLMESLIITVSGGILGVIFGFLMIMAVAFGANLAGYSINLDISWGSFAFSVLVTSILGLLFGIGPARKAARLQPVIALSKK